MIVIKKCATGSKAGSSDGKVNLGGYIGKPARAEIAVKAIVAKIGDQKIGPAIIIIVAGANGLSPPLEVEAAFGEGCEFPFSIVDVEGRQAWGLGVDAFKSGAVENQ